MIVTRTQIQKKKKMKNKSAQDISVATGLLELCCAPTGLWKDRQQNTTARTVTKDSRRPTPPQPAVEPEARCGPPTRLESTPPIKKGGRHKVTETQRCSNSPSITVQQNQYHPTRSHELMQQSALQVMSGLYQAEHNVALSKLERQQTQYQSME